MNAVRSDVNQVARLLRSRHLRIDERGRLHTRRVMIYCLYELLVIAYAFDAPRLVALSIEIAIGWDFLRYRAAQRAISRSQAR